jgi:hypothetical protein
MITLCTYCSLEKDPAPDTLPAAERYRSRRIERVHQAANLLASDFLIFSGRYGLLPPGQPIENYDYLLQPEDVGRLAGQVAGQLTDWKVTHLLFCTLGVEADPQLPPYHNCITMACKGAGVELIMLQLPEGYDD